MKYFIQIFGCQFNESDSERAAAIFDQSGYVKTEKINEADLIMVMSCSVRQMAIDRIVGLKEKFAQIRKIRPLVTILSGCVLGSDEKMMAEIFDMVVANADFYQLPKLLKKRVGQLPQNYLKIHPNYNSKFQAYVPIMTGCNNFCSYCVVPYTRGREVSRPAKEVISECRDLINRGYKEIILIGQNVNSYRPTSKFQGINNFPRLLKAVDKIPGDYWLSFASSHPKDMSDELIDFLGHSQHLMPYLHLPAQAGDDEILRRMNRRYTVKHYVALIKKVRKSVPKIMISTDIIVGFPGETKKQFLNTAKLFRTVKFDMAYLARYSPRPGTVSAKMPDNVSFAEKKRREEYLNEILKKTAAAHNKKMVGQVVPVLVESYKNGFGYGRTKNFKNIKFASEHDYTGQIIQIEVIDSYAWGLTGRLPKVLVIAGTTASGKTNLAVKLAKKFRGEIISADSRQVYTGMDIGTGKDLKEYGRVPYHLIDVVSPKEQFSAARWQKSALAAVNEILNRGHLPIICGGTGLYISSLLDGYNFIEASDSKKIRQKLNKQSLAQLLEKLKEVDAATFVKIDQKNRRRVQRALEIYYQTGLPKSEQPKSSPWPYDFKVISLTYPREILLARITKRLKIRLEKEGMVKEIARLHRSGVSWARLEEFGLEYRFIARYLQKKIDYKQMFDQLNQAIADFAKRQMTWFKRDSRIIWENNFDKVQKIVSKFLA